MKYIFGKKKLMEYNSNKNYYTLKKNISHSLFMSINIFCSAFLAFFFFLVNESFGTEKSIHKINEKYFSLNSSRPLRRRDFHSLNGTHFI